MGNLNRVDLDSIWSWDSYLKSFIDLAKIPVEEFAKYNIEVIISDALIFETYKKAEVTLASYNLGNEIDHYKIAGHLCYWITKIKPVYYLIDDGRYTKIHTDGSISEPESTEHADTDNDSAIDSLCRINENIALSMAILIIDEAQEEFLKTLSDDKLEKYIEHRDHNKELIAKTSSIF